MTGYTQLPLKTTGSVEERIEHSDGTYTIIVRDKKDSWGRKTYDSHGRVIHYESKTGYWSRHCWKDNADGTTLESYFNCKGVWVRRLHRFDGELLWEEREDGHWDCIINTSHRILFNDETRKYRLGSVTYDYDTLICLLSKQKNRVCPSVLMAIAATNPINKENNESSEWSFSKCFLAFVRRLPWLGHKF